MTNWRANLILLIIIIFGATVTGRLFFIQIINGDLYKALAQGLYGLDEEILQERGKIFLKNGERLAVNVDWPLVFSSPYEIENKTEAARVLAEILDIDENFLLENFKTDSLYFVIKKKLTNEELEKLKTLNIKGIHLAKESGRYYPQEELASQAIGFLDADGTGRYGLEGHYDEILQEKRGTDGSDLVLTIDYPIQFAAEKLLERAKETLEIETGEIIVIEPNSGKILALVNYPNFNPNQYSDYANEEKSEIFQNSAAQKIFEPGSVFKPITMAAALDQGIINPSTTYEDPGIIKIGGWPIYNYEQRTYPGQITMTEVLEKSINTGAVFVEEKIPHNVFLDYIEKFGIFESTGIDMPETCSENKEFKKGYEINFATASFGQGIEMTSLQLIRAYCVIANGGKLVTPFLVEKIRNEEENITIEPAINEKPIIFQKTASQLTAMLVSVVENGFAKPAQIPGYYVAGKTGTAQIAWSALGIDKSGYSDKTWQTFIGFAPAFDPRFLILVKLNNPQTKTAEYSAVPIFHDLAKTIIDYYQIPPDY